MMFMWEPDMIRFCRDASEYGEYNRILADKVKGYLKPGCSVCDAGCGLGYLALELAKFAARVTAVDINKAAIDTLSGIMAERGVKNIEPECMPAAQLSPDEPYDSMVFCFSGTAGLDAAAIRRLCGGRVFIFYWNNVKHRFSVGDVKIEEALPEYREVLENAGVPFDYEELNIEFGQPFTDIEDAELFFRIYSRDNDKSLVTREFVMSKLTETGRRDFPYYMPYERRVAMITFETKDLTEGII